MKDTDKRSADAEVNNLIRELRGRWNTRDSSPFKELYHYTDARGLLGILKEKKLWATNISYLNDYAEVKYALDLVSNVLDNKVKETDSLALRELLNQSKTFLTLHQSTFNAFVVCFCEKENLLSQWRTYGAGGVGYSVGFASDFFEKEETNSFRPQMIESRLRKVEYQREIQVRLIIETVEEFCALASRLMKELTEEQVRTMVNNISNRLSGELSEYLYFFKNPAFAEEHEWRFVHTTSDFFPNDKIKFRASGDGIIPYIELDLNIESREWGAGYPIRSVTLGPSLHPILSVKSILAMLESYIGQHHSIRIDSSNIPLRPPLNYR